MKSCAAVDPLTGLVMVGSHDGHVYALDPKVSVFDTKTYKAEKPHRFVLYSGVGVGVGVENMLFTGFLQNIT